MNKMKKLLSFALALTLVLGMIPTQALANETTPATTQPTEATQTIETTVPETTVPETTVPETTVPETTVPETTVPETTVPETTVPETTVPETTVPETTVPETTVPETTVPETTEETLGTSDDVANGDVEKTFAQKLLEIDNLSDLLIEICKEENESAYLSLSTDEIVAIQDHTNTLFQALAEPTTQEITDKDDILFLLSLLDNAPKDNPLNGLLTAQEYEAMSVERLYQEINNAELDMGGDIYDLLSKGKQDELTVYMRAMLNTDIGSTFSLRPTTRSSDSGLELNKTVEPGDNAGTYELTLSAYAKGETVTSQVTKPSDIVLVIDQSASMWDKMDDNAFLATAMDEEKAKHLGHYIVNGKNSASGDNSWYLVHYVKDDPNNKPWKFYRAKTPSHSGTVASDIGQMPIIGLDGFKTFAGYSYEYESLDKIMEVNNGLDDDVYVSRYGAMLDAVTIFINSIKNQGVDHRIAIVGFAGTYNAGGEYSWFNQNTGNYLFNGSSKQQLGSITSYDGVLKNVNTEISDIWASVDALCSNYYHTRPNDGFEIAKGIFDNYEVDLSKRSRMVVLLTDGEVSGGTSNSAVVASAKPLKTEYGASLYAVGIAKANKSFLDRVSSNYPDATSMSNGTNVADTYALFANNASELTKHFGSISQDSSSTTVKLDSTTVLKDIVATSFRLPNNVSPSDIQVFTSNYLGNNVFAEPVAATGITVSLRSSVDGGPQDTVDVTGFDYADKFVAEAGSSSAARGQKLIVKVPIVAKEEAIGDNGLPTNTEHSGIYKADGSPVDYFDVPHVDIPTKVTVHKTVVGGNADANKEFGFAYTATVFDHYEDDEKTSGNTLTAIPKNSNGTFNLAASSQTGMVISDVVIDDGDATNGECYVEISETVDPAYELTSVTYTVNGGKATTVTAVNGKYKIPVTGPNVVVTVTNTVKSADLTIDKNVVGNALSLDPDQSFLFHVKGTDAGTEEIDRYVVINEDGALTITGLPVGNYTVTEMTDWSWRYDVDSITAAVANKTVNSAAIDFELTYQSETLTFTNRRDDKYWLDGNDYKDNAFAGIKSGN